ncbi:hypothetical protein PR202_ga25755 [Eleusine coracana subsp. coracana]|uniref:Uncharacterized protein n=1 Tax=Eleusine coracana subsp. coracana TaxID=191504 RepID=A0AAV5DCZ0_ELECO|nr:hypothetical protein PR202_ga25755 [Eleusine coracana subsp. coracana]
MASGSRPMHTSRPLSSPVANRPLSPHLPLKKPQLSATFSISPYFRCCIGRCHHSHPSIHQVQRNVWCLSRIVPLLASTYSGSLKVIKFKAQNWLGALMDIQTIHMFFVLTKLIKVRVLMALDDMEDRRWYQNLATGTLVSFSSAWRC